MIEAASGTGKSSLCSYIYGYRNDYQGIINFDETNIKAYSVKQWVELRKHSLSMLFQDLRIFTELTAIENIRLKNNLTGYKTRKEVLALFEALGLSDKLNVKQENYLSDNNKEWRSSGHFVNPSTLFSWMNPSAILTMTTHISWKS